MEGVGFLYVIIGGVAGIGLLIVLMIAALVVSEWWDGFGRKYCDCGSPLVWGAAPRRQTNKRTGEVKVSYDNRRVCDRGFGLNSWERGSHWGWGYGSGTEMVRIGEIGTAREGKPLTLRDAHEDPSPFKEGR